jgi:glycogen(starch) synthase
MRIAYISYEYPPDRAFGGIATYVHHAAHMMRAKGWDVEVFASSGSRSESSIEEGILVHWISESDPTAFAAPAGEAFARRHRTKPFDVLEGPEYNADARIAKALVPNIPLVVKLHSPSMLIAELNGWYSASRTSGVKDTLLGYVKPPYRLARYLARCTKGHSRLNRDGFREAILGVWPNMDAVERRHASEAQIVAPPCRDLCDYAAQKWSIPRERVRLAPHPYSPSERFLGLDPRTGGFTVGFVGRVERRKGVNTLFDAIPSICRQIPEARFLFAGAILQHDESGLPYDQWARSVLGDYASRVTFAGKTPLAEMHNVYDRMDVCVFPSLWENFPNVCLEAMAAGRAIVASNAGGMRDMLAPTGCGVLVPPAAPDELATAVVSLLRQPDKRVRMGLDARQRVLDAYNYDTIGTMMEKVYREAIALNR